MNPTKFLTCFKINIHGRLKFELTWNIRKIQNENSKLTNNGNQLIEEFKINIFSSKFRISLKKSGKLCQWKTLISYQFVSYPSNTKSYIISCTELCTKVIKIFTISFLYPLFPILNYVFFSCIIMEFYQFLSEKWVKSV